MALSRKEIKNRSYAFAKEWQGETRENAEAKPFWEAFFQVFGITRKRVASFEEPVQKSATKTGFIDLLWKGKLLVEHKSYGKNLDKAYQQGLDYFAGLTEDELPRYVMVSDFERFRLYDLESGTQDNFTLEQLPDHVHLFDFIAGYEDIGNNIEEIDLNIKAAELLATLHDALLQTGFDGHRLEILLVRILFCLFAEDTGIFTRHQFINYLLNYTKEDGSDTEMHLAKLFQVLDTPTSKRNKNLSDDLYAFPYVNGHLFAERIDMPSFDLELRDELIESAYFDWSAISPAIFGSLFQSVMNTQDRRNLGAHYTSERDILRLIKPLFLDELQQECQALRKASKKKLIDFQKRLSSLHFLDPACGCGNFLIVTYRELRRIELTLLERQNNDQTSSLLCIEPLIRLENFHGIEIEEWPARIAEVAMWLTQHQMNREFAKKFGYEPDLLPLTSAVHIVNDNALQLDWAAVISPDQLDYIIGNPPFVGKNYRSSEQNSDMEVLFKGVKNYKSLDFVTCWFVKTAQFIKDTSIQAALVSTNSITMGEQVAPLWKPLIEAGLQINFAHRTFAWESEAKGKAAVHVVIIGFAYQAKDQKLLFVYPTNKAEPVARKVTKISPYLIEGESIIIENRRNPLCNVPTMTRGSQPTDGGNLLLDIDEYNQLITTDPSLRKWIRPFSMGEDFIKGIPRYCFWLKSCPPDEIRKTPIIVKRLQAVKEMRLASKKKQTNEWASFPTHFTEDRQPNTSYLAIPRVSSINRNYIPIGYLSSNHIAGDKLQIIPNTTLFHFGVLSSLMHMVWIKTVGGRLKSDFSYSNTIIYNNFPWPDADEKSKQAIKLVTQKVLDARAEYPKSTLADLYDPLAMPVNLKKAHTALDKLVEKVYRSTPFKDDAQRIAFLFQRYQALVGA